jgi:Protein of unknown function (DUF1573).
MRYILVFAIVGSLLAGCDESAGVRERVADSAAATATNTSTEDVTTIQWIDSLKNYGKIDEGQVLQVAFRFKNTGNKPLVIKSVRPGCGCTAANPPDKPIMPGEEGVINASFDSKGRPGTNKKEIYVSANTADKTDHVLHFDVEVVAKKSK